jgi:hypothetical protein
MTHILHSLKTLHPVVIIMSFVGIGVVILNGYILWQVVHKSTSSNITTSQQQQPTDTSVNQSLLTFTKQALLQNQSQTNQGIISQNIPSIIPTKVQIVSSLTSKQPISYKISLSPPAVTAEEGNTIPFSWIVDGPPTNIKTTSVYYGQSSNPGNLSMQTSPDKTVYTNSTTDFTNGSFNIPLWFTVNITPKSGNWYYRIYALIDGNHYWSDEHVINITQNISDRVSFVDATKELYKGATATFTWEVNGKNTTINTTDVLISNQSIVGDINTNVPPENTPYAVLCNDYSNGTFSIPLRFICNVRMDTVGTFYIRSYAYMNNENIWSEERQIIVK